jgi:hypothetical protein
MEYWSIEGKEIPNHKNERFQVSVFRFQIFGFPSLTPDTLRFGAWKPGTRPQGGVSEGPI